MDTRFIVNPVAGQGRGRRVWAALRPWLEERLGSVEVDFTTGPRTGTEVARRALEKGCRRLIVVGGDGTIHEVANAMAGSDAVMGLISVGTGNDLSRSLGLPRRPQDAARVALEGRPRRVDLGRVNGDYFVNVSGLGFDAEVSKEANRHSKILGRLGATLPFVVALFKMLFRYQNAPARIRIDDKELEGRILLVAVGNGEFYAGGMKIAPGALLDDGWLDVVVAWDLTRLETVLALLRVYKGTHLALPKVCHYRARRVEVSSPRLLSVQSDGEVVSQVPATFEVVPGALWVAVPAGGTTQGDGSHAVR
ncbi:MAG: diacylglycerol kinase family lipid kinase [Acetobacteraceae bacterium]|nr:diacylglycerol kinase family lipid kinase [Acetobacteraceae bacterium]